MTIRSKRKKDVILDCSLEEVNNKPHVLCTCLYLFANHEERIGRIKQCSMMIKIDGVGMALVSTVIVIIGILCCVDFPDLR